MLNHPSLRMFVLSVVAAWGVTGVCLAQKQAPHIEEAKKINATTIELRVDNGRHILVDFYGNNIFRLFEDSSAKGLRPPQAEPQATILTDGARRPVQLIKLSETTDQYLVATSGVQLIFDKNTSLLSIKNRQTGKTVVQQTAPVEFDTSKTVLSLKDPASAYYYGGGVQNGRFSHKGKIISIENEGSWTDGGVASPAPFYWSTAGYGFMWYTFKKGKYDFGAKQRGTIRLYHESPYLDVFFMIDDSPSSLLNDYYQLTGHPVLLPKFAFYEGHLNAYNRDYWKEDSTGILFENGLRYKESQKDNGGIKESLNGEKHNYPFSARAVIDRYRRHDMPLGWILPNDGYGAGYGQTSTLDSNIMNLKRFGNYARQNGVELGLWTQSDLHPKAGVKALLQRDIIKEVRSAGVRVLKTDVAWVGPGYSFGLHGIAEVAAITTKYGNGARPFIITLCGWAGTQRYAAIWTGDQTGGRWEYIRFHIPTYIGAGLSGEPNITSDMDGIFGGENTPVNVRDFEWRTFTPMQLNMDGWGANPKYPQALGEPAASINRDYLKLKSELLPYTYSVANHAVDGLPIVRAMFLAYPNPFTWGTATQYQFMYGPYFLVAPIYQNTHADTAGNDVRNNIYLPEGRWIDYFSGEWYEGDRVINSFDAPLWKLPLFVKPGAIIAMNNPNNHVSQINKKQRIYELYPADTSSFTEYNDDGVTMAYRSGQSATTRITSILDPEKTATVKIAPTLGSFQGMVKNKSTLLKFNVSQEPGSVTARVGGKKVRLTRAGSLEEFNSKTNAFFYDKAPEFNRFATKGSRMAEVRMHRNPQFLVNIAPVDITRDSIEVKLTGYVFNIPNQFKQSTGVLVPPSGALVTRENTTSFSLKPSWHSVPHADYYDIRFQEMLYTHIQDTSFLFEGLQPETDYAFNVRAVNKSGHSDWQTIRAKTKINPLQFAIEPVSGYCSAPSQEGEELGKLFDADSTNLWHSQYDKKAVPFDLVIDLKSINELDKLLYLPRLSGRNGIITKAEIFYSADKKVWTSAGIITWARTNLRKVFLFTNHPTARYIKLSVKEASGDYGSGREIYILRVPGSTGYLPGDINHDGTIDENDLTSYANYTGLRRGDGDFDGYISKGDINKNNLIDAYDIAEVATRLDGGVTIDPAVEIGGTVRMAAVKKAYKKGDRVDISVRGIDLHGVNALSFALPYNPEDLEYEGMEVLNMKQMKNLTYDRLHHDGSKALYPTFVNVGNQETLGGTVDLFILKFRAKRNFTIDLKPTDGILVGKNLDVLHF